MLGFDYLWTPVLPVHRWWIIFSRGRKAIYMDDWEEPRVARRSKSLHLVSLSIDFLVFLFFSTPGVGCIYKRIGRRRKPKGGTYSNRQMLGTSQEVSTQIPRSTCRLDISCVLTITV